MIVDCHVHLARQLTGFWQPLRFGKVQDRGQVCQVFPPSFDPPTSPPEVLLGYMDQAGVDRAFILQHHLYGDQNALAIDAVRRWPDRFVGFAYLGAVDQPDAPDRLERLIEAGLTGLKIEVATTRRLRPDFRFDGEREWRVWERLDQLGRPLILDLITATPDDLPALRRLIEELPRVRLVICHVGGPQEESWQERALLAQHPQVWIDLASLPAMVGTEPEYPYPRAQEVIRWAVETFGADRVMWGTDYPPALNSGTYRQLLDYVRRHCAFLTADQRQMVLGGAAERFLRGLGG
ncbi:MAG: amidohydrolase [Chloroflexi bacterium]|nr:amidohydrolase [Chloroflexota bacterium]